MHKFISIVLILFFVNCSNKKAIRVYSEPGVNDINEIVETFVSQDSFPFFDKLHHIPLALELRKIQVKVPDTTSEALPQTDDSTVSIFDLFNVFVNHQRFFKREDSAYFLFQNEAVKQLNIGGRIKEKIATITANEIKAKENSSEPYIYYDLTVPVFSMDNKKAYVILTHNCPFCGSATAVYLEKIDTRWKIVGWNPIWMN